MHKTMTVESEIAELKLDLLKMDIQLRRKQVGWETPKNVAILAATMAAVIGAIAGFIGFKIGQVPPPPPPPPVIIQLPPAAK